MNNRHDLRVALGSHIPILVIESHEENRVLELLAETHKGLGKSLYSWTIVDGVQSVAYQDSDPVHISLEGPVENQPVKALEQIRSSEGEENFVLIDFHPYLENPFHIRLIKEIAQKFEARGRSLIFLSHELEVPEELGKLSMHFDLSMPSDRQLKDILREVAEEWKTKTGKPKIDTDKDSLQMLLRNLGGLTEEDARRLIRNAIYDDGAITESDIDKVIDLKKQLVGKDGVLSFEVDTATLADVAGFAKLKTWLSERSASIEGKLNVWKLDPPKGILLLGVQGCGKSLAARAVAGVWKIPLLRLDFGALYNKYIGETEKNLRETLKTAQAMAPCVLWLDEIEKGISPDDTSGGTSKRILGSLLTWMADKKELVFIVATANDIEALPPELLRKGRFDEIFFVDLPKADVRKEIFEIHLKKRDLKPEKFDMDALLTASNGFSGAEIESAIVSAFYSALSKKELIATHHVVAELKETRPLSVIMAEKIEYLRSWATERTVLAD